MFSMPLSISLCPIKEFIALEPILIPIFAKLSTICFPVCALHKFLYFFVIRLFLSCVGVFVRVNLTFFFVFRLFLGPTVLVLDTLIFSGNFFLLILSYLDTKDVPLGRFTASGTARRQSTNFPLIFLFFFNHQNFFIIGFAALPRIGAAAGTKSPIVNSIPFCFLFLYFFCPSVPNTFFDRLFSSHSNKSSSVRLIVYVLCLKVSPFLHKI